MQPPTRSAIRTCRAVHLARETAPTGLSDRISAATRSSDRVRKLPAKEFFLPGCKAKMCPRVRNCQGTPAAPWRCVRASLESAEPVLAAGEWKGLRRSRALGDVVGRSEDFHRHIVVIELAGGRAVEEEPAPDHVGPWRAVDFHL